MPALDQAEYDRLKSLLSDRKWRLDNLYTITDEQGREVRFNRNEAQKSYCSDAHWRDVILKARQLGFSTEIAIEILDTLLFRSGTKAGIVDETLTKAEEKLQKIKLAYHGLPQVIRDQLTLTVENNTKLELSNGSSVSAGTSYRGGTLQILHVSEYGKISVDHPNIAREIKTGAIRSVHATGRVIVESTAHGTGGEFHDMVQRAEKMKAEGHPLTALDYRLHFYGWWIKKEYRLPNNLVIVPQELREYFEELEAKFGITLDADQRAWYAKQHSDLGPDDVKQEFPSVPNECFYNSLAGAYFRQEMMRARRDGRIGGPVPHDPSRRVNTFWDIGEDCTAVWCHQTDGLRHRLIHYFEEEGSSLQSACAQLQRIGQERKFVWGHHYGPHDLDNREWGNNAQTRRKIAADLGVNFVIVPRVEHKPDAIEAARRFLATTWIDQQHCARGVECLDNYRKQWNERMGMFRAEPMHDWASHGADSLQTGARGLVPDKIKVEPRFREQRRTTAWAS